MYLLVGLGNIGKEYENTRHNFGFMCVDRIISDYNINNHQIKFNADIYNGEIEKNKIIMAKPRTYMNRSGIAVSQIKSFYKINIENIFIFHDDLDLNFLKLKYKIGGGAGGHNGLKSIDEMIGKNYNRIRIGIGRPENKDQVIDFVLHKFNDNELKQINLLNEKISNNIPKLFNNKKDDFINSIYNDKNNIYEKL